MAFFRYFVILRGVFSLFRLFAWRFFVISLFRVALFRYFVFSHGVISLFRYFAWRYFVAKRRKDEMALIEIIIVILVFSHFSFEGGPLVLIASFPCNYLSFILI